MQHAANLKYARTMAILSVLFFPNIDSAVTADNYNIRLSNTLLPPHHSTLLKQLLHLFYRKYIPQQPG